MAAERFGRPGATASAAAGVRIGSSGDCADDTDDASDAHLRMGLGDGDEAVDAAAVDTHLERLSYLSYACPVSRVPLTAEIFEGGDADDENDSPATHAARRLARRVDAGEHEVHVGNVEQYLADVVRYWFADGVAAQVEGFREGLSEIFPVDALKAFSAEEITELVCGKDAIEWTREGSGDPFCPGSSTPPSPRPTCGCSTCSWTRRITSAEGFWSLSPCARGCRRVASRRFPAGPCASTAWTRSISFRRGGRARRSCGCLRTGVRRSWRGSCGWRCSGGTTSGSSKG